MADPDGAFDPRVSQRSLLDGGERRILVNTRKSRPDILDERGNLMAVKRRHNNNAR